MKTEREKRLEAALRGLLDDLSNRAEMYRHHPSRDVRAHYSNPQGETVIPVSDGRLAKAEEALDYKCAKCGCMASLHPIDLDDPGTQLLCDEPKHPDESSGSDLSKPDIPSFTHEPWPSGYGYTNSHARRSVTGILTAEDMPGGVGEAAHRDQFTPTQRRDTMRWELDWMFKAAQFYFDQKGWDKNDLHRVHGNLRRALSEPAVSKDSVRPEYALRCDECGRAHILDTSLPSHIWNQIAKPEDILCAVCIDQRLIALGMTAEAEFYFAGKGLQSKLYDPEPAVLGNCMYCDKPVRFGEQAEQHFSHATCDQQERESVEALEGEKMQPCWGDFMQRIYQLGITDPSEIDKAGEPAVPEAINVVFDGPPGPNPPHFVEVEMDDGKSVRVGEWIERPDGMWSLRIERSVVVRVDRALAQHGEGRVPEAEELARAFHATYNVSGMLRDEGKVSRRSRA